MLFMMDSHLFVIFSCIVPRGYWIKKTNLCIKIAGLQKQIRTNKMALENLLKGLISVTRFGKSKTFWQVFCKVYLVFGKIFNLLWQFLYATSLGYPALPGMIQNRY